jgi:hypothetical protein
VELPDSIGAKTMGIGYNQIRQMIDRFVDGYRRLVRKMFW